MKIRKDSLTAAANVTDPLGKMIKIIQAIGGHLKRHPSCKCCMGILEALELNDLKKREGQRSATQRPHPNNNLLNDPTPPLVQQEQGESSNG
jgi:hypothetical protein